MTPHADEQWDNLRRADQRKAKKVGKALRFLRDNPSHPGLNAHKWDTLRGKGPNGEDVWTAYVENHAPSAWRIFYFYDAQQQGVIWVVAIEPHS